MTTLEILENAKRVKTSLALMSSEQKTAALINMAEALEEDVESILRANNADLNAMRSTLSDINVEKAALSAELIHAMAENLRAVAKLPDPIGKALNETVGDGYVSCKVAVPLGVAAFVYENKPSVTTDIAALSLKSGNVCVLKCGSEVYSSVRAIIVALRKGLKKAGVSLNAVNLIEDTSEESVLTMLSANDYLDVLIARGGKNLGLACREYAKVPCIFMGAGICHVYVDESADEKTALDILEKSKCVDPAEGNAAEVCIVHKSIAHDFLPKLYARLVNEKYPSPVNFKLDEPSLGIIGELDGCDAATEDDFDKEFLNYTLAVKIVDNIKEAVAHIAAHSTGHTDCIVTENEENAKYFMRAVDSASVCVNVATVSAEEDESVLDSGIGISTQKMHARGPVKLQDLTSYKYIITRCKA